MEIQVQDNERYFTDFLSRQPINDPKNFVFDLDSFRQTHPQAAQQIIKDPSKYYRLVKSFLEKTHIGQEGQKKRYEAKTEHYNISFEGNLGANFVTPRGLGSKLANELVGVQGIITKMDVVKHQLQKSVHWCEKTKSIDVKQYPDNFNPEKQFQPNKTRFIKTHDQNNNPLSFEYGLSSFRNIQSVVIQQLPEMAPPGLLPQSVNVILQGDLVNKVKPGDRVQMIGIYKLIGGAQSKERGIFKPYFLCLSVRPLNYTIVHNNKLNVKMPCQQDDVLSLFSRSVAPSIFGHDHLKKAVLLMLLGGCEKNLQNGTHLRGDINLLMVGDPGTAKSQILRWVLSTADLAIGTTGSGASGVGLTAAIVADKDTGEKTLQAGAMVLADRGVVCIDQFDKMNEIDRVAVHEVMEQQTVTIAKAGMHCSLNARCSVIAAANPIYGEYQQQLPPTKNIGMPDSLLSRFDLVFIILDQKNAEKDKRIGERVCRNHRLAPKVIESYNQYNEDDDYVIHPNQVQMKQEQNIFEKSNIFQSDSKAEVLTQYFLKKYINYCKQNVFPILSDDSIQLLAQLWTLLRQEDFNERSSTHNKVLPITIRSYETLIRLSTAHAKLRQSSTIEIKDCLQAFHLMIYCLYGDEKALDEKLRDILKSMNLELEILDREKNLKNKVNSKKEKEKIKDVKRMDEQTSGIIKKMSKIDIGKDERDAEKIIKKAIEGNIDVTKEQISIVFKALTEIKSKKKGDTAITMLDVRRQIQKDSKNITDEELGGALRQLGIIGHIHYESETNRIYM